LEQLSGKSKSISLLRREPDTCSLSLRGNRSTLSAGGFLEIDAPTGIRTPVVTLKGLRPDLTINKHNPDLPEITYSGSEHWRVSNPVRNVSSLWRSTILRPLKYYSLGFHRMDYKNRRHVSERPSFPRSRQTWNGCGSFWRWVQVSPRRMNRGGRPDCRSISKQPVRYGLVVST
jgi:hypothetical protein